MSNKDALKMLKDELSRKADADTLKKLENAKSKKEALSILEGVSLELEDDVLAAVAGGDDDGNLNDEGLTWCSDHEPDPHCWPFL